MFRVFPFSILAVAILAAPAAQAYEAGDIILRAGVAHVDPDSSSSRVNLDGAGPIPGWEVEVDSDTQLGLTGTYMLTPHIGLGLLASSPFKHDIEGAEALDGADLGETKHLPPTLTLQYFPMTSASRLQPYAGIGINYTHFFDEKTTPTLTGAVAGLAPDAGINATKLDLDDSVGLALELGLDFALTDHFGLNAAIWYVDIDTDATITAFADGAEVATATSDVEIDPLVYMIGVSYRF
ncbi:MAG: outer membrane beta-barrel protein [Oleiphilaceae bacterium]|nr:outer membrane beta-barrel protein [Oleiphilaceae bacterium]